MAFIEPMHRYKPNITYLLPDTTLGNPIRDVVEKCVPVKSLGRVAVGVWITFVVGHDFCISV